MEDGREITVFGRYRMARLQFGTILARSPTLVIEVPRQDFNDLLKVVTAVNGEDEFPQDQL